jgi:hypothetical protein
MVKSNLQHRLICSTGRFSLKDTMEIDYKNLLGVNSFNGFIHSLRAEWPFDSVPLIPL